MDHQLQSPLFSLPAELRNAIHALVLTTETNPDGSISLETSQPPSPNLSLTCPKAHQDFHSMYQAACRTYYHERTFAINTAAMQRDPLENTAGRLAAARHIRTFRLDFDHLFITPATVHISVGRYGTWEARVTLPRTIVLDGVKRGTAPLIAHMADTATNIVSQLEGLAIYDFMVWDKIFDAGRWRRAFTYDGLAILVNIFVRSFYSRQNGRE